MNQLSTRLVRLLNMVPYFQANPKITYAEAASDLGEVRIHHPRRKYFRRDLRRQGQAAP